MKSAYHLYCGYIFQYKNGLRSRLRETRFLFTHKDIMHEKIVAVFRVKRIKKSNQSNQSNMEKQIEKVDILKKYMIPALMEVNNVSIEKAEQSFDSDISHPDGAKMFKAFELAMEEYAKQALSKAANAAIQGYREALEKINGIVDKPEYSIKTNEYAIWSIINEALSKAETIKPVEDVAYMLDKMDKFQLEDTDYDYSNVNDEISKAEDKGEGVKIECTNNFYPASCDSCGWFGSSERLEGCHQIADTGDYSDPLCPVCFSNKVEECESSVDFQELKSYYDLAINKLKLSVKAIEEYSLEKYFNDAPQPTNSLDELERWVQKRSEFRDSISLGALLLIIQELKQSK